VALLKSINIKGEIVRSFTLLLVPQAKVLHIDDAARRVVEHQFLKLAVKLCRHRLVGCRPGGVEDLVDLRIFVMPQRVVPRPGAVIPGIHHQVGGRSAKEAIRGKPHLAFYLGEELVRRHRAQLHVNARLLGSFAECGRQPLARRIRTWYVHFQAESIRYPRLGQQLLRGGDVGAADRDVLAEIGVERRDRRRCRRGMTEHRDIDEGRLVDQLAEGSAHADVVERFHLIVPDDALPPARLHFVDVRDRAVLELVDLLGRQVEDRIDRTAFERRHDSGELRNDADDHAIEFRHAGQEIVGVAFHHQLAARAILDKAEGPSANRMCRQFVDDTLADDRGLVGGCGGRQIGIRDRQVEPVGQRIDDVDTGDDVKIDPQDRADVLSWIRLKVKTTSAASNGLPLWNFTPGRRWKVQVFKSSAASQLVARSG
jgi:hypothetical protein